MKQENISPEDLLFDPNNFRFQDEKNFIRASEERYHEESVQTRYVFSSRSIIPKFTTKCF